MGESLSGLPRFDRQSTMSMKIIITRPNINRSSQRIAVKVNGSDATLVGRDAKVSVDRPDLRTSASQQSEGTIRRHYLGIPVARVSLVLMVHKSGPATSI